MATAIAALDATATPYSKKFLLIGDGLISDPYSLTQLLATLEDGPLKRTLAAIGAAALATLNVDGVNGDKVRLYNVAATHLDADRISDGPTTITWVSNADPAVAGLRATLVNLESRILEMRLNHSTQA